MQLVSVASSRSLPLPSLALVFRCLSHRLCAPSLFLSLSLSLLLSSFRSTAREKRERGGEQNTPGGGERNESFAVLRGAGNVRPRRDPFNIADAALLARNEACRESQGETRAIAIVSPARFTRFTRSLSNGPMLIIVVASAKQSLKSSAPAITTIGGKLRNEDVRAARSLREIA